MQAPRQCQGESAAGAPGASAMSASLSLSLSSSARFAAGAPFGLAGESSSSEHSARRRPATGAGAPPLSLSLPPPASSWTCDRTAVVSYAGCRPLRACYAGHSARLPGVHTAVACPVSANARLDTGIWQGYGAVKSCWSLRHSPGSTRC